MVKCPKNAKQEWPDLNWLEIKKANKAVMGEVFGGVTVVTYDCERVMDT